MMRDKYDNALILIAQLREEVKRARLAGLWKAFDLVTSELEECSSYNPHREHPTSYGLRRSLRVIQDEAQCVQIVLNEITEDDDECQVLKEFGF